MKYSCQDCLYPSLHRLWSSFYCRYSYSIFYSIISIDFVVDKGTYDALACGFVTDADGKQQPNKTMIKALTQEMVRVTARGGSTVIITNGTPEKRLADL